MEGCEDIGFGGMSGAFCFNRYEIMLVVSGKRGDIRAYQCWIIF